MKRARDVYPDKYQAALKRRRMSRIQRAPGGGQLVAVAVPRSYGSPRYVTERKYFDTDYLGTTLTTISTSWASTETDPSGLGTIFCPSEGNDFNNRVGRRVRLMQIRISGWIYCASQANQTAGDNACVIRLLLVQDKQTNGAQLNAEDVLNSSTAADAIDMFQNPAFFGRFKVWKDKKFILQNPNMSWDGTNIETNGLMRPFKMNLKFKVPIDVHFNSTNGGTVADIIDHSFHVIGATNNGDLVPKLYYKCRCVFLDP